MSTTNIGGNGGKETDERNSSPGPAGDCGALVDTGTGGHLLGHIAPSSDDFGARAAILELDAKLDRHEAETVAAREQGYADAFAYADAVVAEWRRAVETTQPPIQDAARWEEQKRIAIEFLTRPVAADAARSGWTANALFGVLPKDAGQYLAVGAVFRQPQEGLLFAFDNEVALYRHADGGWHPRYITDFDTTEMVQLWEAAGR